MNNASTSRRARNPSLKLRLLEACLDSRHHRALVLAANVGLVACAAFEPFTASLALHLALLPFNAWQLLAALRKGDPSRFSAAATPTADVASTRRRAKLVRSPAFEARDALQTVRLAPRQAL